jgi:hypothetical protein
VDGTANLAGTCEQPSIRACAQRRNDFLGTEFRARVRALRARNYSLSSTLQRMRRFGWIVSNREKSPARDLQGKRKNLG